MIQENELRFGNWINNPSGNPIKITAMDFDNLYEDKFFAVNSYQLDACKPIPLTPEILQKCGFIQGDDVYDSSEEKSYSSFVNKIRIALTDDGYRLWINIDG